MTYLFFDIFDTVKTWCGQSLIIKAILFLWNLIIKGFRKSRIVSVLYSQKLQGIAKNSIFGRLITWIFTLPERFYHKVGGKLAEHSLFVRLFQNLEHKSSLVFLWVRYFVQNSFFYRLLFGKSDSNPPEETVSLINWVTVTLLAGLIVLGAVKGALMAVMAFSALIFVAAVLIKPEVGIYFIVALTPFLPTMALAGILLFTLISFLLSAAFLNRYTMKLDATGVFIVFFSILLIFYGITSYSPQSSIKIAALEICFILSYFLIVSMLNNKEKIKQLIFLYATSAAFTGLVGFYQFLSGKVDKTWTDTTLFTNISLRVYSTFENPNVYGEYLLLAIPLCVGMFFCAKSLTAKLYYIGISALLTVNLALTYSRGCYLAILLAAIVFIFFTARKLLALGFLGIFILPFVLPQSIISRFASITNFTDTSTAYRINIWEGTIRMLNDFWLFGIGLGNEAFNTVYPKYALNSIAAPHAHSLYLQVFSEMGIVGIVTLVLICFVMIGQIVKAHKKQGSDGIFLAAVLGGFFAFLMQGATDYVWYNYRVFLMFFITMGLISAFCAIKEEGENLLD